MNKNYKISYNPVLSFKDVLIVPEGSTLKSRDDAKISVALNYSINLELPVFIASMDSIVSNSLTDLALNFGAGVFQHKNQSVEAQGVKLQAFREHLAIQTKSGINAATVGINNTIDDVRKLISCGPNAVLFEMSHIKFGGQKSINLIKKISDLCKKNNILFIAGNIATYDDAAWLSYIFKDSIDLIKVGYGSGATSTSSYVSGVGYPTFQSILDIVHTSENFKIPVIADGGIHSPGDLCKAIAAGAIAGCIGSMFAGTFEAPGEIRKNDEGVPSFKQFWGSSSPIGRSRSNGRKKDYIHGGTGLCPIRGSASIYLKRLRDGLKSAVASTNSKNIQDFQENSRFVLCSHNQNTELKI